jgi:hypothetical protein
MSFFSILTEHHAIGILKYKLLYEIKSDGKDVNAIPHIAVRSYTKIFVYFLLVFLDP